MTREREALRDFATTIEEQTRELERLYESHLRGIADRVELRNAAGSREACARIVGVRQLAVLHAAGDREADQHVLAMKPPPGAKWPEPALRDQAPTGLPRPVLRLPESTILDTRTERTGWIDRPGQPLIFWQRRDFESTVLVFSIDRAEVAAALDGWFRAWLASEPGATFAGVAAAGGAITIAVADEGPSASPRAMRSGFSVRSNGSAAASMKARAAPASASPSPAISPPAWAARCTCGLRPKARPLSCACPRHRRPRFPPSHETPPRRRRPHHPRRAPCLRGAGGFHHAARARRTRGAGALGKAPARPALPRHHDAAHRRLRSLPPRARRRPAGARAFSLREKRGDRRGRGPPARRGRFHPQALWQTRAARPHPRRTAPGRGAQPARAAFHDARPHRASARTARRTRRRGHRSIAPRDRHPRAAARARTGQVVDRDTLLGRCWGLDYFPESRTLDTHIAKLRKRLEPDPANPVLIETVRGVGYRFRRR